MNEPFESPFFNVADGWEQAQMQIRAESARRIKLLRRLRILLAAGAAA
ncbi:MAG: hypothetical protein HY046_12525, partial [Acidobacteria bacterium]|nr:hypothetical protein [Acidobacteriota bacterium]